MPFDVTIPQLTQTMEVGLVTRWLKQEGEAVQEGEPLFELETDKATIEVESLSSGILGRILVSEGQEAAVGAAIAIIIVPGESSSSLEPQVDAAAGVKKPETISGTVDATGSREVAERRVRASPVARRVASESGVDLAQVTPSTPGGLITVDDVRQHMDQAGVRDDSSGTSQEASADSAALMPAASSLAGNDGADDEVVVRLTGLRKTIADRLSLSRRTAADVTTVAEVDLSEVSALREHVDLTYTAFVLRAVTLALTEFPALNSRLDGDRIVISRRIHLGVAMATDDGLKVPVIRDAHVKSLRQIGLEVAEKVRMGAENKLSPDDLTGSTFTVTNSGVFGSLFFTPIINPPESAILGMGKIAKTPVVRDDQIVIRKMMYLCLTYDHRVVDGEHAVRFLQRVKALLEMPALLL
ncbi:MAG: 2-oxo acid dehydrogenase subunit E2 [Thermoleophilia bacterium]|nr:2-oxo acid dehydrogenase subunit E2 [Thermoleophilia bacterium]